MSKLNKYVQIGFVLAGLMVWIVATDFMSWAFDMTFPDWNFNIIGVDFRLANLLGMGIGVGTWLYLKMKPSINVWAKEVATELSKVNWPGRKEVQTSTLITIVFSVVIAVLLGLFDYIWSLITSLIYSV